MNLTITFFLSFFSFCLFSQGFEWNEDIENQLRSNTEEVDISKSRSFLPSNSSLEKYIPFVHHQGETAMCVAYSLANCRTIIYAKNKRLHKEDDIIRNSFSPFFLYYHSKSSSDYKCNQGIYPTQAISFLIENGIAKLFNVEYPDYWPFTDKQLCTYYPPSLSTDLSSAYKYKIDKARVFNPGVSDRDKILGLKNAISSGKPVFFGMDPFPNSLWKSWGKDFWKPDQYSTSNISSMGHAMTIIAYDDFKYGGSFQILNSYGDEWGNGGKIWIRYDDLIQYSSIFVILERKYEESIFGSPLMFEETETDAGILGTESLPEFINTDLDPPLSDYSEN